MNRKFLLSLVVCCAFSLNSFAEEDRVVAQYNDKSIHKSEVVNRLKFLLGGHLPDGKKDFDDLDQNTKQAIIQDVVQQKILESDMDQSKIQDSKVFQQQTEEAKKKVVLDVYLQNYVKRHFNDGMLKTEYNNYVSMLKDNPEVKISHVLVATEEEAKKVAADLKGGKSFEDEAKQVSIDKTTKDRGGEIGYISKGQAFPTVEKAAFSMKVGGVSDPVHTEAGWHILKVTDIKAREVPSFDAIKPQLEQQVSYKIIGEHVKKLMVDAKVKIFPNKNEVGGKLH